MYRQYLTPISKSCFRGKYHGYGAALRNMQRAHPALADYLEEQAELSTRLDIERYVLEVLVPRIEKDNHIADCREWIFLMSTFAIGPP